VLHGYNQTTNADIKPIRIFSVKTQYIQHQNKATKSSVSLPLL